MVDHVVAVITETEFERLKSDEDLFLNVIAEGHSTKSYLVTYEELLDEVLDELDLDKIVKLEGMDEDDRKDFEKELISDYIMKRDIYSYGDLMSYPSGEIDIWRHPMQSGEVLVSIDFFPEG